MEELFNLYKQVLLAHIQTKTTCPLFHEKSAAFYELLFEVFHTISEKRQDLGLDKAPDEYQLVKQTYDNIEKAKASLEAMVKEKNSVGMDNLLRGLVDKLESECGNAKALLAEEQEEVDMEALFKEEPTK